MRAQYQEIAMLCSVQMGIINFSSGNRKFVIYTVYSGLTLPLAIVPEPEHTDELNQLDLIEPEHIYELDTLDLAEPEHIY